MNILLRVDEFIITHLFQRFCSWTEYRWGWDNFAVAYAVIGVDLAASVSIHITYGNYLTLLVSLLLSTIVVMCTAILRAKIKRHPQYRNPIGDLLMIRYLRLYLLAVFFVELQALIRGVIVFDLRYVIDSISLVAYVYLMGCNPNPPGYKPKEKVARIISVPSRV